MNQESGPLPSTEFLFEGLGTSCLIAAVSIDNCEEETVLGHDWREGGLVEWTTASVTTPQLTVGLDSRAELLRPTLLLIHYFSNLTTCICPDRLFVFLTI